MTHRHPRSTLADILHRSSDAHLVFHLEGGSVELSGDELAARADAGAATLAGVGIGPGDRVGVLGPNRPEWAVWAFAAWKAGAALAPLPIPLRVRDPGAFADQIAALVAAAGCRIVLADPDLLPTVPEGMGRSWGEVSAGPLPSVRTDSADPAVAQFTSGSTAFPKGVVLSHRAVLASVRATEDAVSVGSTLRTIGGWVPFFHDLGLFSCVILPIASGLDAHILPTERFAVDPAGWFRMMTTARAQATSGPTSGWGATLRAALADPAGIDLRELRYAAMGAEGIDCDIVDRILAEGPRLGLRPDAVSGGYGQAEFTLAATTSRPGEGIRIDRVDPVELVERERAVPTSGGGKRIASSGRPMLDVDVRIEAGEREAPERHVGEILLRGPSMMSGYVGSEESPVVDGWLHTGDLGYLADGELYVTGRIKDMVIVMGQNHYPEDFEWAAGRVDGVRTGRCVAFGHPERPDEVVLIVEPRDGADPTRLRTSVRDAARDVVVAVPLTVLVLEPGTVEKTTSGKLRRQVMREAFSAGTFVPLASTVL